MIGLILFAYYIFIKFNTQLKVHPYIYIFRTMKIHLQN